MEATSVAAETGERKPFRGDCHNTEEKDQVPMSGYWQLNGVEGMDFLNS